MDSAEPYFPSSPPPLQRLPSTEATPKKKRRQVEKTPLPLRVKREIYRSKKPGQLTKRQKTVPRTLHFDHDDAAGPSGSHNCTQSRSNIGNSGDGGLGSSGKWLDKDTPKKNWICVKVQDLGCVDATCQMCERERIRYVHTMTHEDYGELEVGCICAGHLSGDISLSKERQAKLEQRLKRRENFPKLKNWKVSAKKNSYIVFQRGGKKYWVVVTRPGGKYSAMVEDKSPDGEKKYVRSFNDACNTEEEAQLAAFDYLFPPKLDFNRGGVDPDFGCYLILKPT